MYRVSILEKASQDIEQLDKTVATRIYKRINWFAKNISQIQPEPLTGEWARFFKLRVGDWRVIYKILHEEHLIVIHRVRHRREVYR